MPKTEFKREAAISKEFLQTVYDSRIRRDERNYRLGEIFTEMTGGGFRSTIYDAEAEDAIDGVMKILLGETLYSDWSYLVDECQSMDGGGLVRVNGNEYRVSNVDDLWCFWEREGLI